MNVHFLNFQREPIDPVRRDKDSENRFESEFR